MPDTNNPRYPHWVKVTRTTVNSDVNPPIATTSTVFEGECRNFQTASGGTGTSEGVVVSDYTIDMPYNEIRFDVGDTAEITNRVRTFQGTVINSYNGNLGCRIWHNEVRN